MAEKQLKSVMFPGLPDKYVIREDFVSFNEQDLPEEKQAQARANIGAITLNDVMNALPAWTGGSY